MKHTKADQIQKIMLAAIDEPVIRDRLEIDSDYIQELAASIQTEGLQQAILVRPVGDRFEIVYGDCRFLAHKLLGRVDIDAKVRDLDDVETALLRGIENLQRRDLSPVEEALSFKRLHETCGLTWEEIARRIGKSAGLVKRRYDLLHMPKMLIDAVHKRLIPYSVAEVLHGLKDEGRISYFLEFAVDHGATLDVVRRWVADERNAIRQKMLGAEGGGYQNPLEPSPPVYVPCDLCREAMEIGTEKLYRCCSGCVKELTRLLSE